MPSYVTCRFARFFGVGHGLHYALIPFNLFLRGCKNLVGDGHGRRMNEQAAAEAYFPPALDLRPHQLDITDFERAAANRIFNARGPRGQENMRRHIQRFQALTRPLIANGLGHIPRPGHQRRR